MPRPRWLLEFDDDFPAPELVKVSGLVDFVELSPGHPWDPRWPSVPLPAVAYGTMRTLRRLQQHPPLALAVFDNYPSLRCSSYLRYVYDLLGREAFFIPLAAVEHLDLRRHFGDRFFVRPETNYKLFASQIVPTDEAARFVDLHREHLTELVVVAEVVDLGEEFRCFCRKGRVVAHSSYPQLPYRPAPPDVLAFAEACAARIGQALPLLRMVTVDVARSPSGQLRLVEIGGVNSWGLYGCDVAAFVEAMEAEAIEIWQELSPP